MKNKTNEGCFASLQGTSLSPFFRIAVVGAFVAVVTWTPVEPVQIPQVLLQFIDIKYLYVSSEHHLRSSQNRHVNRIGVPRIELVLSKWLKLT